MTRIVGSKAEYREADYRFLRHSSPASWEARAEPVRGWCYDLAVLACLLAIGAALWLLAEV